MQSPLEVVYGKEGLVRQPTRMELSKIDQEMGPEVENLVLELERAFADYDVRLPKFYASTAPDHQDFSWCYSRLEGSWHEWSYPLWIWSHDYHFLGDVRMVDQCAIFPAIVKCSLVDIANGGEDFSEVREPDEFVWEVMLGLCKGLRRSVLSRCLAHIVKARSEVYGEEDVEALSILSNRCEQIPVLPAPIPPLGDFEVKAPQWHEEAPLYLEEADAKLADVLAPYAEVLIEYERTRSQDTDLMSHACLEACLDNDCKYLELWLQSTRHWSILDICAVSPLLAWAIVKLLRNRPELSRDSLGLHRSAIEVALGRISYPRTSWSDLFRYCYLRWTRSWIDGWSAGTERVLVNGMDILPCLAALENSDA